MESNVTNIIDINAIYLENLKRETTVDINNNIVPVYPNIQNFYINNNILQFNEIKINIDKIYMTGLNSPFFKMDANKMIFILQLISTIIHTPETIEKEITYLIYLMNLNSITEEEKTYIINYLNNFYLEKDILNEYFIPQIEADIQKKTIPLGHAYENENSPDSKYNKPASILIREFEQSRIANTFNNDTGKDVQRVRKSNKMILLPEDEKLSYIESVAGFASTTIIISIAITLGITISVLTLLLIN